jgi:TRAP-type mannitol/chloroaromatic compound transport system permease small subunit
MIFELGDIKWFVIRRVHVMNASSQTRIHDVEVLVRQSEVDDQAWLDLVLFIVFFMPGVAALTWAGWGYASDAWAIKEHTFNADPLPLYPFKSIIPLAGLIVFMQGLAEILRCVVCIRTGEWTPRLKDAEEIDVVEQQLGSSTLVDREAALEAIANVRTIDESAHQRAKGGQA